MKRQLAMFLVWTMVVLSIPVMTGCNGTPVEIVQNAVTGFNLSKTYVADARGLLPEIATLNPELAKIVGQFATVADQGLDTLLKASNAYLSLPSGDTYQAILNGVDALMGTVNASVLAAAKVTNPDSQAKVLAAMTVISTVLQAALVLLKQKASKAQLKAVPKIAGRTTFDQVKPYLNREYAREQLTALNYDADAVLQAAGL